MNMDDFTCAYVECALWSSTGDNDQPLDESGNALAPATLATMQADCAAFQLTHGEAIDAIEIDRARAGHDFWLTRCGHGAGFWDGDWPEPLATTLDNASKAFGNVDLYIGDDGLIYS